MRYGAMPAGDDALGYVGGVYTRALDSVFYQSMIVACLGATAYCVALVATLEVWVADPDRKPGMWLSALVGLRGTGPGDANWDEDAPFAFQLAANPIRDAAVIFPAVGFIGTVVGVSSAIGGLNDVIDSGETGPLLDGLRIAFDTTFIGLVASVVLTTFLYLIQSRMVILRGITGLA